MAIVSSREAARALGISVQRVRALARAGRLPAGKVGHRWVVNRLSPGHHERRSGRPLSPGSAWGVLALLSGFHPSWIHASSVSRLRCRLKNTEWALRALERSQARSKIERFRFLPSDLAKIRKERGLVLSGLSALTPDFNVVEAHDHIDAYVDARKLNSLQQRYRPAPGTADANVTLRVPSQPWIMAFPRAPSPVIAADLLEDQDARVSRAGRDVLRRLLNG
jgi:excisionase family DNA binding protein